jgi:hypothetical protein
VGPARSSLEPSDSPQMDPPANGIRVFSGNDLSYHNSNHVSPPLHYDTDACQCQRLIEQLDVAFIGYFQRCFKNIFAGELPSFVLPSIALKLKASNNQMSSMLALGLIKRYGFQSVMYKNCASNPKANDIWLLRNIIIDIFIFIYLFLCIFF